jgi:hypothetical protein
LSLSYEVTAGRNHGVGRFEVDIPQMNVVEKESEGDESEALAGTDVPLVRKNGAKNGSHSPAATIVNRFPMYRDVKPLSQVESRRFMSERSSELRAFVGPLEERVRKAYRFRARKYHGVASAQAKVAELVLDTIRRIAHRETGVFNLEAPLTKLLSVLYAGSVEAGIVTGLTRRAQKALAVRDALQREVVRAGGGVSPRASRGLSYDVGRELDELVMLLRWYVRRKMSVSALELETLGSVALLDALDTADRDDRDVLFDCEVMHDHQVFGTRGCLLSAGLKLVGRDSQLLWLRVSLRWRGQSVKARPEWSSWTDPGDGSDVEILSNDAPFCSLVPIRPHAQRLVIDEIRAFVPYAALDLPAGRCDVEIVAAIVDGSGHEVVSIVRPETVCVPQSELASRVVPSPHSVGMWPHDVVSGDKISEFQVVSGFKVVAGWERHSISVHFDLSLFMHAGEAVTLECRFLDGKGSIVELSSLGIPFVAAEANVAVESVSSYRYRRVLHPKGAWALYQGLCIDIPVEFLQLVPGMHDITCELIIVSSDDRILCGDMGRVEVQVPPRDGAALAQHAQAASESRQRALGAAAAIELESIEVDPAWYFGGEESVRVQATFCPRNTNKQLADLAAGRVGELFAPYRVEISLEREDGHVLLQAFTDPMGMSFRPVTRAVCVDGHNGFVEHSVVANFDKHEVLGWSVGNENGRGASKVRLFARVTALTPDGELIVSENREFFVRPVASGAKRVVAVKDVMPTIVDAVASTNVKGGRLSIRTLINIPGGEFAEDGLWVKFVLSSPGGVREEIGSRDIAVHESGLWTRQVTGLNQCAVEWEHDLRVGVDPATLSVEILLLSATSEQLDRVQQRVRVSGVLTEVETDDEQGSQEDREESVAELADSRELAAQPVEQRKSLWRRLFE